MTHTPFRIGLIGASRIAQSAVIDPARAIEDVTVHGVAARDPSRAKAFARLHGIPHTYATYAAMIAADDIDLIYIATPPHLHAELACAALTAGKPALVEKPFAMTTAEAMRVAQCARQVGLPAFEAMHALHHPLFGWLSDALASGTIGRIERIEAGFDTPIAEDTDDFRWCPALGGGVLMDLGIYPLAWARFVAQSDFEVLHATAIRRGGVDAAIEAELRFEDGITASICASMLSPTHRAWLTIKGSAGRIHIDNPLVPQTGHRIAIHTATGARIEQVSGPSTYEAQLRAVVDAVRKRHAFPWPDNHFVQSMVAIDRVRSALAV